MTDPEVKVLMLKGNKGDGLSDDDMQTVKSLVTSSVADAEDSINDSLKSQIADTKDSLNSSLNSQIADANNSLNSRIASARFIPTAFSNSDAIKQAYPNGSDGIFVAADTGHMWLYVNHNWIDAGAYQSAGVDKTLSEKVETLSDFVGFTIEDGYIDLNGAIILDEYHNWSHTEYIPTSIIKAINWPLWFNASCVAYYDKNKNFVGYEVGTGAYHLTHEAFTDLAKLKKYPYVRLSYRDSYETYVWDMSQYISFVSISDLEEALRKGDWNGKACAFLGDSITDGVGTTKAYWSWMADLIGIKPTEYGVNGEQWTGVLSQAQTMKKSGNDYDAIFVFAGTNDFHASVQLGDWYAEKEEDVNWDGTTEKHKCRVFNADINTFRGRINNALSFLKKNYPTKQIILMTPIHRGYATFSSSNVQPDETYANRVGLYISDYVNVVKEAGDIWSVPVIDLFSDSGLFPIYDEYDQYMHTSGSDELHPNALGHQRLAQVIAKHLNSIPATLTVE